MILDKELLQKVINTSLLTGADFAEVFVEDTVSNVVSLVGGKVEKVNSSKVKGAGIRIAQKLKSVYGYTNDLSCEALIKLAKDLSASFEGEASVGATLGEAVAAGDHHKAKILPNTVALADKVAIAKRAYKAAKEYDEEISQVNVTYLDTTQHVQIANNSGLNVTDDRVSVRMSVVAVAAKDGVMQTGHRGPGGAKGFEFFSEDISVEEEARKAARIAKTMLHADECPSGKMTVVIDNEFGGVIFHEACGHSLEATSVARNASVFCGKLGEKVASEVVTAIDDGTIENAWGSANIDDEGNPQQRRVLIEKGILKSYMVDELNARRMNCANTASSRRESYKYAPTSRMSNTYIDNGESTFEEIIAATEYGLYAKSMGGGSVNPGTGDFNFSVNEGYIIRNGKICEPVRGASLVGTGREALLNIDMVANNLRRAQGMCGSSSGSIRADVGQPTIRIQNVTVGGRKGAN